MKSFAEQPALETYRQPNLLECRGNSHSPKPFIKWAGGKSRLIPVLRKCVPRTFGRYFEPFLGGGALFFDLLPKRAVLGDSNQELISCFETVRDKPGELIEHLDKLKVSKEEYYRIRGINPKTLSDVACAARFIYLNKTCFNGLYRVNKNGVFNTPFGLHKSVSLADGNNLYAVSAALRNAKLVCNDYSEIVDSASAGDFVYLDPPYLPVGKYSDFKRYTREQFYESDHQQLADVFRALTEKKCLVLLSNSYHEKISNLFAGFHQATVSMPRFINCRGNGRGAVKELLISNYPTALAR
jgi:DNA adenine methylase